MYPVQVVRLLLVVVALAFRVCGLIVRNGFDQIGCHDVSDFSRPFVIGQGVPFRLGFDAVADHGGLFVVAHTGSNTGSVWFSGLRFVFRLARQKIFYRGVID